MNLDMTVFERARTCLDCLNKSLNEPEQLSEYSDWIRAERTELHSLQEQNMFSCVRRPENVIKQPQRESVHAHPQVTEVKIPRSSISAPYIPHCMCC
jgi:hypothetical protein